MLNSLVLVSCSAYSGENQLGEFLVEVRLIIKDELDKQVEVRTAEEKRKAIEDENEEDEGAEEQERDDKELVLDDDDELRAEEDNGLVPEQAYFHKSHIPGEGFVAAANTKLNPEAKETAYARFKTARLMFPHPLRKFLWEDFIYQSSGTKDGGGGGVGGKKKNDAKKGAKVGEKGCVILAPGKVPTFP